MEKLGEKEFKPNPKQRMFIEQYLRFMNATKAAEAAGYSKKTAGSQGHDLLKKPEIRALIDSELDRRHAAQKQKLTLASDSAISALVETIEKGKGLARVQAANSILDRAGHKPIDRIQADVNANVKAEVDISDAKQKLLDRFNRHNPA